MAEKVGVEPYVLRYWEQEFKELHPRRANSGRRIYTASDIELIFRIKKLLYEEHYTIEGVQKKLSQKEVDKDILTEVRKGLDEIIKMLK
ncbi:MAG: MerR family transcriptional regulator [Candidatus Stahlbacteria bacterium]|nr:MerR family transcriptional regulator [Candidatus Stahlbacteria bacterium]